MSEPLQPIRMRIKGLMLDPSSNLPIVILRDEENSIFLPIWIGVFEANAIALEMEDVEPPRPLTHDLLKDLLETVGASVSKILISALEESTFFAQIHLEVDSEEKILDARPSDAIALALRVEAPIFVLPDVLEEAKAVKLAIHDEDRLRQWLEDIDPAELGKYEM